MESIRERLEEDLRTAVGRLRQMGGAVAVEELPRAIGDNAPFADEVDEIQANESREIGFTHVWRTACASPKVKGESHEHLHYHRCHRRYCVCSGLFWAPLESLARREIYS